MNRLKLAEALVASAVRSAGAEADKLTRQTQDAKNDAIEAERRAKLIAVEASQAAAEQKRIEAILDAVKQA